MSQVIVLFDGTCGLCSRAVRFLYKHDKNSLLRFASQSSPAGQLLMHWAKASGTELVILSDGQPSSGQAALLKLALRLPWPWKAGVALKIFPASLRNRLYALVAKNRHRFFPPPSCSLSDSGHIDRFLTLAQAQEVLAAISKASVNCN